MEKHCAFTVADPRVVEQTGRGERSYDIFSRLLKDRIICRKEKAVKRLAKGWNVTADEVLLSRLTNYLGESCVKVIEKPIESVH